MTKHSIIGAVLAGGHGRRIGRDKATVELDGRPLISYPVGALRAAGLDVVLALRDGQEAPAGLEDVSSVRDEFDDADPLAARSARNEDGPVGAIDAAIILQHGAGLLPVLSE